MKAKNSRGARRAAAKELWAQAPAGSSFSDHWKVLNDEDAQKRYAADQRKKKMRRAR